MGLNKEGSGNKLIRKVGSIRIWIAVITAAIIGLVMAAVGTYMLTTGPDKTVVLEVVETPRGDSMTYRNGCWVKDPSGKIFYQRKLLEEVDIDTCQIGYKFRAVLTNQSKDEYRLPVKNRKTVGAILLVMAYVAFLIAYLFYRWRNSETLAAGLLVGNLMN